MRSALNGDCLTLSKLQGARNRRHHEGTFPYSKEVIDDLFKGVRDITEKEKADIIGGNAVRLFHLNRPEFLQAA
jgi:hypothetical protein